MDSGKMEKTALLIAVLLIAGIAVFFLSSSQNAAFVARPVVKPQGPVQPDEPGGIVDCSLQYAPACGGSCKMVNGAGQFVDGTCALLSEGGCGCSKNTPSTFQCSCSGTIYACDPASYSSEYGVVTCVGAGSSCQCPETKQGCGPPYLQGVCQESN